MYKKDAFSTLNKRQPLLEFKQIAIFILKLQFQRYEVQDHLLKKSMKLPQ